MKKTARLSTKQVLMASTAFAFCAAQAAFAQTAEVPSQGAQADGVPPPVTGQPEESADNRTDMRLDTVMVTSRFREESVQDIGESISVLGKDDIDAAGLVDFASLATRIPGLNFSNGGPNRNVPRIRGVSQAVFLQDSLSSQPLVSSSVNEISVNSPGFNQLDILLFDIDRVEVLKGPQGTRFGEGAAGGAIRYFIRSADPSAGFGGDFSATAQTIEDGGFGYDAALSLNVPLIADKLAVRGTAYVRDHEGFIDNAVTGKSDENATEFSGGRFSIVFEPTENFSGEVFGMMEEGTVDSEYFVTQGPSTVNPGQILTVDDLTIERPDPSGRTEDYSLVGAKLKYDFGAVQLESVTGRFERDSNVEAFDPNFTQLLPFATGGLPGTVVQTRSVSTEALSQELRLVSNFDGPFNFVAGAFYRTVEFSNAQRNVSDAIVPFSFDGSDAFIVSTETLDQEQYAVFLDASYEMTPKITVLGGVRYFSETIEGTNLNGFNAPVPLFGISFPPAFSEGEVEIEAVLPRASIEYRPNDNLLYYVSYAEGARNGGINPAATASLFVAGGFALEDVATFDRDDVASYEAGIKSTWLDGNAVLNGAVFHTEFSGIQTLFRDPFVGSALSLNGPDAEIQGFEIDTSIVVSDWLDLFAKLAYTDAEFVTDNDTNSLDGLPVGAAPADILAGDRLAYTPKVTYNIGAQTSFPYKDGHFVGRIDFSHIGDFINSAEQQDELDSYGRLDLRFGYEAESWSITAFANNATNDIPVLAFSLEGLAIGTPRVYGVTLRKSF